MSNYKVDQIVEKIGGENFSRWFEYCALPPDNCQGKQEEGSAIPNGIQGSTWYICPGCLECTDDAFLKHSWKT